MRYPCLDRDHKSMESHEASNSCEITGHASGTSYSQRLDKDLGLGKSSWGDNINDQQEWEDA